MKKFYITTAIPYVNGKPHIGHVFEYFQADTIRRYHALQGEETLLLSGADENALKNVQAAEKEQLPIQQYLDTYAKIWRDTYTTVGVEVDVFQRGSDPKTHWPGVQKLWSLCEKKGDIYKKSYEGLYCVGCESFKTEKDLVKGLCPDHQTTPERIKEENYFFKLSAYQDTLLSLIETNTLMISPENKRAETLSFIKSGLADFSISRSNERAQGVGVPILSDPQQKVYVWFDALTIYMTGIGFGWDEEKWQKWWPADLHVIGKDINRFHTVYWPAMLLSAGLPLPKEILIHGFVTAKGGEKFSKSLGNAPAPEELINKYGLEPLRYYLLSQIPIDADGDFTEERFTEVYNADLANGLGNLVARVAKLCEKNNIAFSNQKASHPNRLLEEIAVSLQTYKFNDALQKIWSAIRTLDQYLSTEKPWQLDAPRAQEVLTTIVTGSETFTSLLDIAVSLRMFLPQTARKIEDQFSGETIHSQSPLFPRL